MQRSQVEAPVDALYFPAGQLVQAKEPESEANKPLLHGVQASKMEPVAASTFPAPHLVHSVMPVVAATAYVPAAQEAQLELPEAPAYLPAAHGLVHAAAPVVAT